MSDSNSTQWDVVVVGAGIAGAAVAWQLVQAGQRVLLLEREIQPGYHTTGRSAALFEEHYGPAQVRALTRASRTFYEAPPPGLVQSPILSPRGVMYIGTAQQRARIDAAYAQALVHAPDAPRLDAQGLRARVPVLSDAIVDGFVLEAARDIDVHGLHQGFLRPLRHMGALWCTAQVQALERVGTQWRVALADGRSVQAAVVVNAAGAWADVLGQMAGAAPIGLTPKRRSAFTFNAPEGMDASSWPAVISCAEDFYFKPDAGQLLGSPANADATTPHDVQPEELDIATGIWRIEEATTLTIRRPSHTWAGLRSFVADGELVVGWDASPTPVPGFFWVAAQGGYGIQSAAGYSLLARNLIVGEAIDASLLAQGVEVDQLSPARVQRV